MPQELGAASDGNSAQRICTECGHPFVAINAGHKVCSPKCRTKKMHRKRRGVPADPAVAARGAERQRKVEAAVEEGAIEIARDIIREELRPVVREHLSADVLRAIGDLVELTPLLVAALKDDLEAQTPVYDPETGEQRIGADGTPVTRTDYDRRARAASLLAKHTIGSAGLAPQPVNKPQPITVEFGGMPRPDWDAAPPRTCEVCGASKPAAEFAGESARCQPCHDAIGDRARLTLEP